MKKVIPVVEMLDFFNSLVYKIYEVFENRTNVQCTPYIVQKLYTVQCAMLAVKNVSAVQMYAVQCRTM